MKRFKQQLSERTAIARRKTADYLNRKTAGLSRSGQLAALIGFCLLTGSYCLYLLIHAFY